MRKSINYSVILLAIVFGCKKKHELPGPETPVISVTEIEQNVYVFKNATPGGGYITKWDFAGLKQSEQYQDTVFFGTAGTYKVTLFSNSKGGFGTTELDFVVSSSSPYGATQIITPIDGDPHRFIVIDTTKTGTSSKWKFGNGVSSTKKVDTVYYPFAGTYKISLTANSSKGESTSISDPIVIAADDPSYIYCSDEVITFLTGGCSDLDGKTWLLDPDPYQSNVGPASDPAGSYYDYPDGLGGSTWTDGALNNDYTFNLHNLVYAPRTTNATIHFDAAYKFFGIKRDKYADIALQDPKHAPANFIITHLDSDLGTGTGLTITDGSYIGYFENRYHYYIVSITADTMRLAHNYNGDENTTADPSGDYNARRFTFVWNKK